MYQVWLSRIGYPERRNILDLPFRHHCCVRRPGPLRLPAAAYFRLRGKGSDLLSQTYFCRQRSGKVVVHLFNGVCFGGAPWVSTFETSLPRWQGSPGWVMRLGYERIADARCLGIIAISNCTAGIFRHRIGSEVPDLAPVLANKLEVIHPPQPVIEGRHHRTDPRRGPLLLAMVGRLFFTKGGRSVLAALKRLYLAGRRDWRLHIVSKLEVGDEESGSTEIDRERARRDIAFMEPLITLTPSMTQVEVLELFQRSHVALLPSLADTYGYVVLEAQSTGCPVITTNIRALPEINDASCGWTIDIPKDPLGFGLWRSAEERTSLEEGLTDRLAATIEEILDSRATIEPRSDAATSRIRRAHDPSDVAARLEDVYMRRFLA